MDQVCVIRCPASLRFHPSRRFVQGDGRRDAGAALHAGQWGLHGGADCAGDAISPCFYKKTTLHRLLHGFKTEAYQPQICAIVSTFIDIDVSRFSSAVWVSLIQKMLPGAKSFNLSTRTLKNPSHVLISGELIQSILAKAPLNRRECVFSCDQRFVWERLTGRFASDLEDEVCVDVPCDACESSLMFFSLRAPRPLPPFVSAHATSPLPSPSSFHLHSLSLINTHASLLLLRTSCPVYSSVF